MYVLNDPWWLSFSLIFSFPLILFVLTKVLLKFDKSFSTKARRENLVRLNSVSIIVWVLLTFYLEFVAGLIY